VACLLGLSLLSSDSAFFSDTRQRKFQSNERSKGKAVISQAIAAAGVGRTVSFSLLLLLLLLLVCLYVSDFFPFSSSSFLIRSLYLLHASPACAKPKTRETYTHKHLRTIPSSFLLWHARPLLSRFLTLFCPPFSLPPSLPPSRQPS